MPRWHTKQAGRKTNACPDQPGHAEGGGPTRQPLTSSNLAKLSTSPQAEDDLIEMNLALRMSRLCHCFCLLIFEQNLITLMKLEVSPSMGQVGQRAPYA